MKELPQIRESMPKSNHLVVSGLVSSCMGESEFYTTEAPFGCALGKQRHRGHWAYFIVDNMKMVRMLKPEMPANVDGPVMITFALRASPNFHER